MHKASDARYVALRVAEMEDHQVLPQPHGLKTGHSPRARNQLIVLHSKRLRLYILSSVALET